MNLQYFFSFLHFGIMHAHTSGFPCGLTGKESACNVGDLDSIPRLGRSPGEGNSNPLQSWRIPWTEDQDSPWNCRELDTTVQLTFTFTFMLIIQTHKCRYKKPKQIIKLNLVIYRRKWQTTPMFLPGESQGGWSLVGCRLWGRTESDMTEAT